MRFLILMHKCCQPKLCVRCECPAKGADIHPATMGSLHVRQEGSDD
jgi:hypothetical protein